MDPGLPWSAPWAPMQLPNCPGLNPRPAPRRKRALHARVPRSALVAAGIASPLRGAHPSLRRVRELLRRQRVDTCGLTVRLPGPRRDAAAAALPGGEGGLSAIITAAGGGANALSGSCPIGRCGMEGTVAIEGASEQQPIGVAASARRVHSRESAIVQRRGVARAVFLVTGGRPGLETGIAANAARFAHAPKLG